GDHESKLFHPFNVGFRKLTNTFLFGVNLALTRRLFAWLGFAIVVAILAALFWFVPKSFIPSEDQGYLISSILLPDGASLQRTQKTGREMQEILFKDPSIAHAFVASGRDFIGGGNKPNAG